MINTQMKKFLSIMMIIMVIPFIIAGCTSKEEPIEPIQEPQTVIEVGERPIVQIEMEDGGIMVFELYPDFAPDTVVNFLNLSKSGFYDGLTFHRIIEGFMIQGGDPKGDGTGGSGENIPGEFAENGFRQNTLKHTRGVISMARSNNPNSASSQFFIMHDESSFLDGKYAAFGKLIEGEDVLDKIAETEVELNPAAREVSLPTEDVVIKSITVVEQ